MLMIRIAFTDIMLANHDRLSPTGYISSFAYNVLLFNSTFLFKFVMKKENKLPNGLSVDDNEEFEYPT